MSPHQSNSDPDHLDRDYDVTQGIRRRVYPAIGVYFVLAMGCYELVRRFMSPEDMFGVLLPMAGILAFVIVGGAIRSQQRQMSQTHIGYAAQDRPRPLFLIGSREYTRYRVDDGHYQGITRGGTGYFDRLQEREREQRKMDCDVCHDTIGHNGGYFVETRRLYRIFGLPIWEKIVTVEAYCTRHKPRDFQ